MKFVNEREPASVVVSARWALLLGLGRYPFGDLVRGATWPVYHAAAFRLSERAAKIELAIVAVAQAVDELVTRADGYNILATKNDDLEAEDDDNEST